MEEIVSILTMGLRINLDKVDVVNTQNIQIGVENTMTMTLFQIKCAVRVVEGIMVIFSKYSMGSICIRDSLDLHLMLIFSIFIKKFQLGMWKQLANYGKNSYSRSSPSPVRRSSERRRTTLGNLSIIRNGVTPQYDCFITNPYTNEIFTLLFSYNR